MTKDASSRSSVTTVQGAWQLPKGGVDEDKEPAEAARRELYEETRLSWDQVQLLGEHPRWLAYELGPDQRKPDTGREQVQRWFVVRLTDRSATIDIGRVDERKGHPEFRASAWMSVSDLLVKSANFRRPVYEQLTDYLRFIFPEIPTGPPTEDTRAFLLAEHEHFGDSFWRNEETGEKRVNFLITLVTAVLAALVALASNHGSLTAGQISGFAFRPASASSSWAWSRSGEWYAATKRPTSTRQAWT